MEQRRNKLRSYFGISLYPCYFGLALVCTWDYGIQRVGSAGTDGWFQIAEYLGVAAACLVFFLIATLGKKKGISNLLALSVLVPILAAATAFFLTVPTFLWETKAFLIGGSFVAGLCTGWLYVSWGSFYAKLTIKQALFILFSSVMIASLLKALIALVGSPSFDTIMYVAIPFVAMLCLRMSLKNPPELTSRTEKYNTSTLHVFKTPAIGVVVFSFVIGILLLLDGEFFTLPVEYQFLTHALVIAVCIIIIALAYIRPERIESSTLWLLALLVVATGLVVVEFFAGSGASISLAIIAAAQRFIAIFIWLAVSDIAHNSTYDSDIIFGLGKGIYALSVACGAVFANSLHFVLGDVRLSLLVIYVLMLALLFLLRDPTPLQLRLFADLSPSLPAERSRKLEEQVEALGKDYGLSAREKEIVILYAQGRNRSFISTELFISENTARDHIRNIYKKMRIHSKQDLIDEIQKR